MRLVLCVYVLVLTRTACGKRKGFWFPEDCVLKCESLDEMYTLVRVGTYLEFEPAARHV
jgi:hypothetical protein